MACEVHNGSLPASTGRMRTISSGRLPCSGEDQLKLGTAGFPG